MPRHRDVAALLDPEYHAIEAGLRGEPCPAGGNQFAHLDGEFPSRRIRAWHRIRAVFESLPADVRRAVVQRRRRERDAVGAAESRKRWLARNGGAR
jgi:hypothetical protein